MIEGPDPGTASSASTGSAVTARSAASSGHLFRGPPGLERGQDARAGLSQGQAFAGERLTRARVHRQRTYRPREPQATGWRQGAMGVPLLSSAGAHGPIVMAGSADLTMS